MLPGGKDASQIFAETDAGSMPRPQALLCSLKANPSESIGSFRMEVADLRKFAVLNYIAVIKCAASWLFPVDCTQP